MDEVVLVSGVRTAIGRFQGGFANTPAVDLAAHVIREAIARAGCGPENVDQVILGCVGQVMEDAYIARAAAVKADARPVSASSLSLDWPWPGDRFDLRTGFLKHKVNR